MCHINTKKEMRKRMSHEENTLDVECLNLGSFVCGKAKDIVKPSPHVEMAGSTQSQMRSGSSVPTCCFFLKTVKDLFGPSSQVVYLDIISPHFLMELEVKSS
jgi:hypothetical protein